MRRRTRRIRWTSSIPVRSSREGRFEKVSSGRVSRPALVGIAEVHIAAGASGGDRSNVDAVAKTAGLPFELVEPAHEFFALAVDPITPLMLFRAQEGFVAPTDRGIENAIGKRPRAEAPSSGRGRFRE